MLQSKLVKDETATTADNLNTERVGVAIGMGLLDLQDILDVGNTLVEMGYSRVSPYFIPRILPNLASGQISIKYGFGVRWLFTITQFSLLTFENYPSWLT